VEYLDDIPALPTVETTPHLGIPIIGIAVPFRGAPTVRQAE
jgi:hypothetical protein